MIESKDMGSSASLSPSLEDAVRKLHAQAPLSFTNFAALDTFIQETGNLGLADVAQSERAIRSTSYFSAKERWNAPDILRLLSGDASDMLWFELFSWDGYRREKALNHLNSPAPNAFLFAVLVRRLNDWVPQVRRAARGAVANVVAQTQADLVAELAWSLLPRRPSWGRLESDDEKVIDALTAREDVANLLSLKLQTATSGPGARVLQQASRSDHLDNYLLQLAQTAKQPSVRARAYRILFDGHASWVHGWHWKWLDKSLGVRERVSSLKKRSISIQIELLPLLSEALRDRSVLVRRVAGDALVANRNTLGEDAKSLAITLLQDDYPSIVERGEFILKNT